MTDVVLTRLTIVVDAVLGAHPVADICIPIAATLRCVVLTAASFWCAEEATHGVVALLIAVWAF